MYKSPTLTRLLAEQAQRQKANPKPRLADHRAAKLLADGQQALALRNRGVAPADILLAIGGSRPRMYKAIHAAIAAQQSAIDPLLS
jgi:hypothetical protein